MSATPDSTLANPEQRIADLERQLAERTAERDEALHRETAIGEVLGIINSSPGDLAPVFDAMLEKAIRLCEADYGHVLTFDGQLFHLAAIRGEAAFVEWRRRLGPVSADSGADGDLNAHVRLLSGEDAVQVQDLTAGKAYRLRNPITVAFADLGGARSALWVALRKDGSFLGYFVIYRQEVRAFLREACCVCAKLRRPGSHRDGERQTDH